MQETPVLSLGWEDPWRRKLQPTPVFLPGESHGQRSLVGYSAWGCKDLDVTERLNNNRDKELFCCWYAVPCQEWFPLMRGSWFMACFSFMIHTILSLPGLFLKCAHWCHKLCCGCHHVLTVCPPPFCVGRQSC